jgi:hypothetical protein
MASRHLFRHLHDLAALKRNRLVAHLLSQQTQGGPQEIDQCERVRRSLFELAERCRNEETKAGAGQAERRYRVFLRAVLKGEPWRAVAEDLGLSRRQFTRDKTSFSLRVAQHLNNAAAAFHAHTCSITNLEADATLAAAQVFADCGDIDKALKMMRDVANSSASTDARLEAVCAEARLTLARSYLPPSNALISKVQGILQAASDRDGLCGMVWSARLDTIRAESLSRSSSTEDAFRLLGRALRATRCAAAGGWRDSRRDALRALRIQMQIYFLTGALELAKAASEEAERDMDVNTDVPLSLKADVLSDRAVVLGASAKTTPDAQALLLESQDAAARAGLRSRALAATIILLNQRNRHAPFERISECIATAERLGDDVLFVRACLAGSEQQLLHEPSRSARLRTIGLLARAEPRVPNSATEWAHIKLLQAQTFLLLDSPERAVACAAAAEACASRIQNRRFHVIAMRLLAEIYQHTGQVRLALDSIGSALASSQRLSCPFTVARCYAIAAEITGQSKYLRVAADICRATGAYYQTRGHQNAFEG